MTGADLLERIARATRTAHNALRLRDQLIRQASAAGMSLRTIAPAAGMTHAGVRRVIQRGEQNRENDGT